jgi:16S rRNA (guanine966-N2)-methyltransferase
VRLGGGTANRRPLRTLAGQRVRPTSSRVRQALFNILQGQIGDAIFVDLFAGTGSVGLEALSHGARQVYFVERDRGALQVLRGNINRCGMAERSLVIGGTLPQALKRLPASLQVDVLFLDPPYASDLAEKTLRALEGSALLAPHGMVVWQHAARHPVPPVALQRALWQRRHYGETQLSLYTSSGQRGGGVEDDAWR